MKCRQCEKEIKNELNMIHISDGDFVCDEICKVRYDEDKKEFFDNIGNDAWYKNYMGGC